MTHRDFMRSLSAAERKHLTAKNNFHAVFRLTVLVTALGCLTTFIVKQIPLWQALLPIQGLLLVSLFHLLHECIHDTPFRTKSLNRIVGSICGLILFLPCEWFRYFHRDHHRYTQIEGKDPELDSVKPTNKWQWLLHISGLPVYKSLSTVLFKNTFNVAKDSFVPHGALTTVVREARVMIAVYTALFLISILMNSAAMLWLWLVPLLLAQPFLRMYLLAEHTLCEYSDNMFANTRTVLCNPIVRWLTWNMPYHTEHHIYPGVPFHKLGTLHRKVKQHLRHTNISYTEFSRHLYGSLE